MSERFKLTFKGEVLEGQHIAVVRKRLIGLLKVDKAVADKLFSGEPVTLKKSVEREEAARFQQAFKKAGARLRVQALKATGSQGSPEQPAPAGDQRVSATTMQLAPVGSDLGEPNSAQPVSVDTSHLSVLDAAETAVSNAPQVSQPVEVDVSHLTLAELGEFLKQSVDSTPEAAEEVAELEVDVLPVGSALSNPKPLADVTVRDVDFDLADVGSPLDTAERVPAPAPPDVSHLSVAGSSDS